MSESKFDAIIIGAGMSGGWVAKELCEQGLKTLLLERGRNVEHVVDYPTTNMQPWEFKHRGEMPYEVQKENPIVSRCYAFKEDNAHFMVKDKEHPYVQDKPFDWIRGYQVGGKSLLWARQTQRWSDFDFEGPARDGFSVDWPIRYNDLAPWYSKVELFAGITGNNDGLDTLPDGEFLPAWDLNCVQDYFKDYVNQNYKDRHVIFGRCAHLREARDIHIQQGRSACMKRTECERGCPFGGYFSSVSSTIPWALKSGNLTLRPYSVVESVMYDEESGKASGVRVIDANTKEVTEYKASVIFLNAGSINTVSILLNSKSKRFPDGLGNDNGLLGKYVSFHNYRGKVNAVHNGHKDQMMKGRIPTTAYIPRFQNIYKQETDFLRGYAATFYAGRSRDVNTSEGFGEPLSSEMLDSKPDFGPWYVGAGMMGATLPKETNYVALDETETDEWGMPLIHISMDYDDNDEKMLKHFFEQFTEMFEKAGFENITTHDTKQAPGLDIHEMGGARMGKDPETSILNAYNQIHSCTNVFVTDGACMASSSTQNPSLTYMAISARAANYAAEALKKGEI
ncbi:MAG: GMC family oxidoreductase [Leeuwenhoekiella sp.]